MVEVPITVDFVNLRITGVEGIPFSDIEIVDGVTTVTLPSPLEMDKMRGITLETYIITIPAGDFDYRVVGVLVYEPAFAAPMPPPSFRGGSGTFNPQSGLSYVLAGLPPPPFKPLVPIGLCYAGGYFYPGLYNGMVQVWILNTIRQYEFDGGVFRIKNLAQVKSSGIIYAGETPALPIGVPIEPLIPPEPEPAPPTPAPVPPEVGFTHAFDFIAATFDTIAGWLLWLANSLKDWPLLSTYFYEPLWNASMYLFVVAGYFRHLKWLIETEILDILRNAITTLTISYYLTNWWEATAKPWVQVAVDWALTNLGIRSVVNAWNNFWGLTWPDWISRFNELKANWDYFWAFTWPDWMAKVNNLLSWVSYYTTIILPTLLTFQWIIDWWKGKLLDVQGLINSAFSLRESFWEGWQDWKDSIIECFTDPEKWLLDQIEKMIVRFW